MRYRRRKNYSLIIARNTAQEDLLRRTKGFRAFARKPFERLGPSRSMLVGLVNNSHVRWTEHNGSGLQISILLRSRLRNDLPSDESRHIVDKYEYFTS